MGFQSDLEINQCPEILGKLFDETLRLELEFHGFSEKVESSEKCNAVFGGAVLKCERGSNVD